MSAGGMTILVGVISSILGALGALWIGLLVHRRESKKIESDGRKTEAETVDLHWKRFEREIERQDERIRVLEEEVRDCHREKRNVELEYAKLRLALIDRGNNRQTAQLVISEIRKEMDAGAFNVGPGGSAGDGGSEDGGR